MPSLIDIRRRIRSVKNTQQITKAMKMVSAAKLRRAQDRVIASRPYGALLRKVLGNVAAAAAGDETRGRESAAGAARGAAHPAGAGHRRQGPGRRVQHQPDQSARSASSAEQPGAELTFELIGRKGRDFFRKRGVTVTGEHIGLAAKVQYDDTAAIARKAMEMFRNEEIDAVYLLYNEFKSVVSQKLTLTRVLPAELPEQAAPGGLHLRGAAGRDARTPCCPGTWKWNSTARCWNRPPANMPRA